ncbi:hypothetical protein [Mesorhizobium japonicum]|uniref:hypothetical protein n=1 Tax=Mesorhizobium japonicum TaxID=2066070 RepID=UPI003B5B8652
MTRQRRRLALLLALVLAILSIDWTWSSLLTVVNVTQKPTARATGFLYWVPASALTDTMPTDVGDVEACSKQLTTWLNRHGSLVMTPQNYLVTNTTDKRLQLHLAPQAFDGATKSKRGFYLQCGSAPFVYESEYGEAIPGQRRWLTALVNINPFGAANYVAATDPKNANIEIPDFSMTLKPGEQVGLTVALQGADRFDGQLTLTNGDVNVPAGALPIMQASGSSTTLQWPGVPPWQTVLVHPLRGELFCNPPGNKGDGGECTPAGIKTMIAGWAGAPEPQRSGQNQASGNTTLGATSSIFHLTPPGPTRLTSTKNIPACQPGYRRMLYLKSKTGYALQCDKLGDKPVQTSTVNGFVPGELADYTIRVVEPQIGDATLTLPVGVPRTAAEGTILGGSDVNAEVDFDDLDDYRMSGPNDAEWEWQITAYWEASWNDYNG